MLGEFTLAVWTLFVVTVGVVLGHAATKAGQNTSDEDDGPGAVGADELDGDHGR